MPEANLHIVKSVNGVPILVLGIACSMCESIGDNAHYWAGMEREGAECPKCKTTMIPHALRDVDQKAEIRKIVEQFMHKIFDSRQSTG